MSSDQNFHSDEPIKTLANDTLGRKEFSRNLAKAISRYKGEESLVIGLYGSWGYGKTSIINMVKDSLKQEENQNKLLIVEFKPWYFSGQDKLLNQFFKHLSSKIKPPQKRVISSLSKIVNSSGNFFNKFGSLSKEVLSILKPVKVIPGMGTSIKELEEISSQLENLGKALSGLKDDEKFDPINKKKELDEEFEKLKDKYKILIIIDDIDRLTKEEMRQIFQLVKGLANFPNTIYLLSFDYDVVIKVLKDVQTDDGSKYLEKIIQVPFQIPAISRTELDNYFLTQVANIISQDSEINENLDRTFKDGQPFVNSKYWRELSSRFNFLNYFDNIREINRFLNIFRFEFDFIGNEVNTIDLVVLSAIKSQDNNLYNFIQTNTEIFSQQVPSVNKGLEDEEYNEQLKKRYLEQKKSFNKSDIIELVLKVIFPQFRKLLGENSWISFLADDLTTLQRCRKVGHPDIFDTFFQLSVPDNKIPYTIIKEIISLQNKPEECATKIKGFIMDNKSQELFSELQVYQAEFEENNKNELLKSLLPLGDLIDSNKMMVTYGLERFSIFFRSLLENSNINLDSFIQDVSDNEIDGIYILCELLYNYGKKFDFYDQQRNRISEKIDNSEHGETFKNIEQLIAKRLQKKADDGSLQTDHNFSYYLYSWRRINHEAAKIYVNQLISTEQGIIDYLTGGLSYYLSNRETIPKFDQNYITYFTEIEPLKDKVKEIKNDQSLFNQLPKKSQLAISTFLQQFSSNETTDSSNK